MHKVPLLLFDPSLPQHRAARKRAKQLCMQMNTFRTDQTKARLPIYQELFGQVSRAFIEPDFFCDYGYNIFLGDNFFANHHCVMLDATTIHIGSNVLLGPAVHLYTTTHPLNTEERRSGQQRIAPIFIESVQNRCELMPMAPVQNSVNFKKSVLFSFSFLLHFFPRLSSLSCSLSSQILSPR